MSDSIFTSIEALIGDETVIEIKDGASWLEIPGGNSIDVTIGDRPVNTVETFQGTRTRNGELPKPTGTINVGSYLPQMPAIQKVIWAHENKKRITLRWTFPELDYIPSSETNNLVVNVNTSGVATFDVKSGLSGQAATDAAAALAELNDLMASDAVPEGCVLQTTKSSVTKNFVVVSKSFAPGGQVFSGLNVVDPENVSNGVFLAPRQAVTVSESIVFKTPKLRNGPALADVTNAGNQSASTGQAGVSSQITLQFINDLPPVSII